SRLVMRVALAGGAGFVGAHTRRRLRAAGHHVAVIDRDGPPATAEEGAWIVEDLCTEGAGARAAAACGGVDAVVWLAASIRRSRRPDDDVPADLRLAAGAPLEFLHALSPPPASLVFMSSIQVYGDPRRLPVDEEHPTEPVTSYGVAKLCGEQMLAIACRRLGVRCVSLRASFVYGRGQHPGNVIPVFLRELRGGRPPVVFGDGREVRDDVHVTDVARAVEGALSGGAEGAFNIASGRPRTLLDVAEAACRISGTGLRPVVRAGAGGWVDRWFSIDRARRELPWEPTIDLDEGLRGVWEPPA
ncbi:MAG TPA: NAD-dependent epimerase/dehydratase family protein, partial [Candidatus Polarisedimenticolia bacterium]|nr:NAD-dependent epimerase/dehydratase family protein [Candidatus Polarisedimenticolia bacterium]